MMRRSMLRSLALLASGMLLFFAGLAVTTLPNFAAVPAVVTIGNFAFSPPNLTVPPGTTVTWTNTDEEPHTVVSAGPGKVFKSGGLDTDEKFSVAFDQPGTYTYFCSVHPQMTGTITVK